MLKSDAAAFLAGVKQVEGAPASAPTNLHVITGEVGTTSEDGKTTISLDGLVFSEEDSQEIEIDTLGGLEEGDIATVILTGESGHGMTPLAIGAPGSVDRLKARVVETELLIADKADIEDLEAATARIGDLEADHVSVNTFEAATARIGELEADHVSVSDFEAEQANIDSLQAATADIGTIRANSAKVQNLTAAQLEADHAKVGQLDVNQIAADHATIGTLDTTYMHADMANADVAWIENGTIKDGAIVSAMIHDVSANKLTAGTINGSVINVTNLNADNITAGTINGQRIGTGSLSLDKLSEDVYTESEVNTIVEGLNDRIDGAIETHTGTVVPTLNNQPASSWNTTALKDEHVGDVYYVVNSQSQQNGYCYRFTKSGSTYSWQLIKDSDVTAALSRLTTAEGKITSIESFDSTVSSFMTNTDSELTSVKSRATSLETRMTDAEEDISEKVDTSTFNTLSQTVDGNSASITSMNTVLSNNGLTSSTNITNTVNTVSQTTSGNSSKITQLTTTLGTNADGTTKAGDVMHRTSAVEQDLSGFKTTVSQTYATNTTVDGIATRVSAAESSITQNAQNIELKVSKDGVISSINQSAETVKIQASKVEITGEAVFNAINNDTSTTTINGGKIDADTVHVKAANIDGALTASQINASGLTIGQSQVTGLTTALDGKADTSDIPTNVSDLTNDSGFITNADIPANNNLFGTCSTAAGTTNKTVVCSNVGLTVPVGTTLTVTFSTYNTADAPRIVIKNSDNETILASLPIWANGAVAASGNPVSWTAQATMTFVLHDTYWEVVDKPGSFAATSSTVAATAAKTATLVGAPILEGTVVSVTFSTANTSSGTLTLNVGSTGAELIRLNDAYISETNQLNWEANTTITFVRRDSYWYVSDNGAIGLAEDAAKTATSYVTEITGQNGIMVHPSTDQTTGVQITSDVDILRDGTSVINIGTMGDVDGETDAGVTIYDGSGNESSNILARFTGNRIRLGKHIDDNEENDGAYVDFFDGDWFVNRLDSNVFVRDDPDDPARTLSLGMSTAIEGTFPGTKQFIDASFGASAQVYGDELGAHEQITKSSLSSGTSGRYSSTSMGVSTTETYEIVDGYQERTSGSRQAYIHADELELTYDVGQMATTRTHSIEHASLVLRSPIGTYTGTSTTATASASGWQLTYFNNLVAEVGSPRTYDYTFSNGVLTAKRDCMLEISGVMNWTDAIAGNRGFGIFINATEVGTGTERSAFQNFPNTVNNRKSVVFPPRIVSLTEGNSITLGRYQQQNAVYVNGPGFSWVTIRVVK